MRRVEIKDIPNSMDVEMRIEAEPKGSGWIVITMPKKDADVLTPQEIELMFRRSKPKRSFEVRE